MAETETATDKGPDIVHVPIVKGKTTIAVDISKIPGDAWAEVVLQGLKVLCNRGTSKITGTTYPDETERKTKAVEVAEAQVELIMTSKIKFTGGKKKSGNTRAVTTEATRIAKAMVKDDLKKLGIKLAHVPASEITKAANMYLESEKGAALIEKAKANVAEREKESTSGVLDLASIIAISPELVKKAEAKKAKGGTLSAKKAGMVKQRAKGEGQAAVH